MVTVFALLALVGGGLGVVAMRDVLGGARHGEPNRFEGEKRTFALLPPPDTTTKLVKEPPPERAPPPVYRPPPPPPPPPVVKKTNQNCDPPFTIDPATGRRKYKLECMK
jgi:hypothetical protein